MHSKLPIDNLRETEIADTPKQCNSPISMVANAGATELQDRVQEHGALTLVAIVSVLVAGSLSFGIFPLLVEGFVRLAHFDVQSAGLTVTTEMLGQAFGGAVALAVVERVGSRKVVIAALALIIAGNGLSVGVYRFFGWLLLMRGVSGVGCGLTVVGIGLLGATKQADRNFAISSMANLLCCALLAAGVPDLFRFLGLGGAYAVIAGATVLCLWMVPLIPDTHRDGTVQRQKASPSTVRVQRILTCTMTIAYFVSLMMFWTYAGDLGAAHHIGLAAVSSGVARAWLVGGFAGTLSAIVVAKRPRRALIIVVCAAGVAAATYAAIFTFNPVVFSLILMGFVFFWWFLYPIQMGLFSQVEPSGRLAMFAWFVQLVACAIGPAVGGLVLHVSSYKVLAFCCALGYLVFVGAAFALLPAAHRMGVRTEE